MAYVPPHLRNKQSAASQADSTPRSLESLRKSLKRTSPASESLFNLDELAALLQCGYNDISTLTVSRSPETEHAEASERSLDNDDLRAIVIFDGQHPDWKSDHKILCKSNLHILRKLTRDREDHREVADSNETSPVTPVKDYPLFRETPFKRWTFDFAGWWNIQNVEFLAPRSAELVALFDKKFNNQGRNGRYQNQSFSAHRGKPKKRTEEAWRESLNREWAIVTLEQNHSRKDRLNLSEEQRAAIAQAHSVNSDARAADKPADVSQDVEKRNENGTQS